MIFSLTDANSVNVTPPQDTPISHKKDGKFISFGVNVEIQKAIEKLPRGEYILLSKAKSFVQKNSVLAASMLDLAV